MDKKEDFGITILDSLGLLQQAWSMVSESTVQNCFRHVGFKTTATNEAPAFAYPESDDKDDGIPLARLVKMAKINMEAYINVDSNIPVCAETTDDDIIHDIR